MTDAQAERGGTDWNAQVVDELGGAPAGSGGRHAHRVDDAASSLPMPAEPAVGVAPPAAPAPSATAPMHSVAPIDFARPLATVGDDAVADAQAGFEANLPASSTAAPAAAEATEVEIPKPPRSASYSLGHRLGRTIRDVAGINASREMREYVELHRQLTAAVTSSRRVAVMATSSAQGATTVAALLATALATRRLDPVLLVDAAAGTFRPSLHNIFGAVPVRTIGELATRPAHVSARDDFAGQLTPLGKDMWLIPADHAGPSYGRNAPTVGSYVNAVTPFIRYFDISVTDLSATPQPETADLVLTRAHALCLVTSATQTGYDWVTERLRELRDTMGTPWAGRTIVVVNHTEPGARRPRWRRGTVRNQRGIPIVTLAHDPELTVGFPSRPESLSPATHLAAMRMAADVLGTAMPVTTSLGTTATVPA